MLKKTIHLGGSEYVLYYYDIFQIINELIQSATKLYFNFEEKSCNGKRVFEEIWTADWWREQEVYFVAMNLYLNEFFFLESNEKKKKKKKKR